jgi:hypothetical protein
MDRTETFRRVLQQAAEGEAVVPKNYVRRWGRAAPLHKTYFTGNVGPSLPFLAMPLFVGLIVFFSFLAVILISFLREVL